LFDQQPADLAEAPVFVLALGGHYSWLQFDSANNVKKMK
jgi:hypothetical protein